MIPSGIRRAARPLGLLLATVALARAAAPDSIAGTVYRDFTAAVPLLRQETLTFGADGRYTYVLSQVGSTTVLSPFPNRLFLSGPPADGNYTYTRTGADTAHISFNPDGGSAVAWDLTFTSATEGKAGNEGLFQNRQFVLTPRDDTARPISNTSVRGQISAGHPLIAGFIVPGPPSAAGTDPRGPAGLREVLIRVVGPSLAPLGVNGTWSDPDFQLYRGNQRLTPSEMIYPDWSVRPTGTPDNGVDPNGTEVQAALRKIFGVVGAFPLLANSKDAAGVFRLAPGPYTIVCEPTGSAAGGEALIEVYTLP